jgi:hypothetical protein
MHKCTEATLSCGAPCCYIARNGRHDAPSQLHPQQFAPHLGDPDRSNSMHSSLSAQPTATLMLLLLALLLPQQHLQTPDQLVAPMLARCRLRPLPLSACPPLAAGPPVLAPGPASMPLRLALLPVLRGPPRPFLASGLAAACSTCATGVHVGRSGSADKPV